MSDLGAVFAAALQHEQAARVFLAEVRREQYVASIGPDGLTDGQRVVRDAWDALQERTWRKYGRCAPSMASVVRAEGRTVR